MQRFVFPALAFLLGVMLQGAMAIDVDTPTARLETLMKENDQLEEMFNSPMASLLAISSQRMGAPVLAQLA